MACPTDPPHLRRIACCDAEPKCVLCPLRPENARRPLAELWASGLMRTDAFRGMRRARDDTDGTDPADHSRHR